MMFGEVVERGGRGLLFFLELTEKLLINKSNASLTIF
jgi:hypothetical protein